MNHSLQHYARLGAVVVVVVGCYQVLHPFIPALLFAAVVCAASWPLYRRLRDALGGRSTWAALAMTLLLVVLVIGPSTLLALSLADDVAAVFDGAKGLLDHGPIEPPSWLREVPLVGQALSEYWHRIAASREELNTLLKSLFEPARILLLGAGKAIGGSLVQLTFATFIAFFFFRDGERMVDAARAILVKLAGHLGETLLSTINGTVIGVVHGIFGTALAQALVALIGFLVAGVPGSVALAALTFLLSMVPVGPPLVWGGAAIWLFVQGSVGWGIFMVAWGLFAISSIDNVIKPYLISRASSLPLLLILLGVFGGIVAFGFIGIFIGPPMLAIGLTLVQLWSGTDAVAAPEGPPEAAP
ncbi:AI-2E family transporter [Ideonella sp. DXS29W]|uniref:AI-2E family transporter n=1 Tax=Ideonella lacteola TaxID=2984193 RepID=A0ABU9BXE9_9BURK